MNILTDFFNFLPSLMMAIGPISIYAGMGTGSQSGRMQFKQIFTDDPNYTICVKDDLKHSSITQDTNASFREAVALPYSEKALMTLTTLALNGQINFIKAHELTTYLNIVHREEVFSAV